ncbi:uncharacterized protein J3D65DRAFT_603348 [Phyllosticta citribraziliensis]|uniref:Uncharacterized protein n=1 Tax=Phyllosticta citribraziliensis TaxID=989973 RepID=A0ABR1LTJ0_9PEZI
MKDVIMNCHYASRSKYQDDLSRERQNDDCPLRYTFTRDKVAPSERLLYSIPQPHRTWNLIEPLAAAAVLHAYYVAGKLIDIHPHSNSTCGLNHPRLVTDMFHSKSNHYFHSHSALDLATTGGSFQDQPNLATMGPPNQPPPPPPWFSPRQSIERPVSPRTLLHPDEEMVVLTVVELKLLDTFTADVVLCAVEPGKWVTVVVSVTLDTAGGAVAAAAAQQAGAVVTTVEQAGVELDRLELELVDFLLDELLLLDDDSDEDVTTRTDMSRMSRTMLRATVSVTVATGAATVEFLRRAELRLLGDADADDDASALPLPRPVAVLVDVAVVWAPAQNEPAANTRKEASLMMR